MRFHTVVLLASIGVALAAPAQAAIQAAPPEFLNSNAATDTGYDFNARVATDGAGHWVAVWYSIENLGGATGTEGDILVSRSTDNGVTWTPPAALNTNAATDEEEDFDPVIATDSDGAWLVIWISIENTGDDLDYDIVAARSTDNGATWSAPAPVNTDPDAELAAFEPHLATDGAGNWTTVWSSNVNLVDTTDTDFEILVARSSDNGVTWSDPEALNSNAVSDAGDDFDPQIATNGGGTWVAVWGSDANLNGTAGFDDDILVARSTDDGTTWSAPVLLNTDGNTDFANDGNVSLDTDGNGHWVAVWETSDIEGVVDYDLFVTRSADDGATWSAPAFLDSGFADDSDDDELAQVSVDDNGNWVIIWDAGEYFGNVVAREFDIFVSQSNDNGATWTPKRLFYIGGTSDAHDDYQPHLATDNLGNWVAVWLANELDEFGNQASDVDVLVAPFAVTTVDGIGVIRGTVVDPDGDPVSCATVRAEALDESGEEYIVPVNPNGEFEIGNLPLDGLGQVAASYALDVFSVGFVLEGGPLIVAPDDFDAKSTELTAVLSIELVAGTGSPADTIMGRVVDQQIVDSVPFEVALSGVRVEALLDGTPLIPPVQTFTCGDGRFELAGLPTAKQGGILSVFFSAPDYTDKTIVAAPGTPVDVVLEKSFVFPNSITGVVADGNSGDPVEGAAIFIQEAAGTLGFNVETNVDGLFAVTVPNDGAYEVKVTADGFADATESIEVSVAQPNARADFALDPPGGGGGCGSGPGGTAGKDSWAGDWGMAIAATIFLIAMGRRRTTTTTVRG